MASLIWNSTKTIFMSQGQLLCICQLTTYENKIWTEQACLDINDLAFCWKSNVYILGFSEISPLGMICLIPTQSKLARSKSQLFTLDKFEFSFHLGPYLSLPSAYYAVGSIYLPRTPWLQPAYIFIHTKQTVSTSWLLSLNLASAYAPLFIYSLRKVVSRKSTIIYQ